VDYAPSQDVTVRFPEIPPAAFARAFQLVLPDGRVLEGAAAVVATLEHAPGRGALSAVARMPVLGTLLELAYRLVASHRPAATSLTRLLWGRSVEKPTYFVASALFLRALGLCYLAAFVSLWVQVDGLIGARGILPVGEFLDWVRGQTGMERYWLLPTLCWISSSDAFLHLLCGGGVFAALLLVAGCAPAAAAAFAWLLYLSLAIAGQTFLQFQWDYLLLEAGLLAIFLAPPWRWRIRGGLAAPPVVLLLLRWLLFRLMFSSGWVKLASGDATWRNLSALRFHYETQPLPPWTAWFMHQCPPWFQTVSALFLFFVELVVPFLYFAPRRLRLFAFRATVLLQLLIAASGNYGFFNLLALALALLLLDDQSLPGRWSLERDAASGPSRPWPKAVLVPVACVAIFASSIEFAGTLDRSFALPRTLVAAARRLGALRSFNSYGLFMVMTTQRPEILIEGSNDGAEWRPYGFRWKPGDVALRPRFVAPHQPRLDWQMWFAALGSAEENPWLTRFLGRLLEGSPEVLRLLAGNPFPDHPPRYVRAMLYDYRFTDASERRRSAAWWRRDVRGVYVPVVSRRPGAPGPER
jgi:lipase maturation factor 1